MKPLEKLFIGKSTWICEIYSGKRKDSLVNILHVKAYSKGTARRMVIDVCGVRPVKICITKENS